MDYDKRQNAVTKRSTTVFRNDYCVDDILLAGPNLEYNGECERHLMNNFDMKDKENLKQFLELEINYDGNEGILVISQKRYLINILKRFNSYDCKQCSMPIEPRLELDKGKTIGGKNPSVRELIGCLMYLMLGLRPEISFAINYLSRYQD